MSLLRSPAFTAFMMNASVAIESSCGKSSAMCSPYAAIVDEKILCVHGGPSPELINMDQIKGMVRPCEVPDTGMLCDFCGPIQTQKSQAGQKLTVAFPTSTALTLSPPSSNGLTWI
mmetsp:Transcript_27832/g.64664  ORF Transcript_27832/g.64664 Transcript_27832/m.64664 type:complete len:116 (+) Transcript_27832:136-483(+)